MSLPFTQLSLFAASFLLIACGSGGSTEGDTSKGDTSPPTSSITKSIMITQSNQIESLGKGSNVKANIDVGITPKSMYVLLSNYNKKSTSTPTITHKKIAEKASKKKAISVSSSIVTKKTQHAPAYIETFGKNVKRLLKRSIFTKQAKKTNTKMRIDEDVVGTEKTFYTGLDKDEFNSTVATARKIVSDINTTFGAKTLNIWVSNDSFDSGTGCSKKKCVTQEMVDALADTFLKSGSNNDIYDWVTNIYGEEWKIDAKSKYSWAIAANDEITILLTDIYKDDSANGGTIGYFYSKDNSSAVEITGSNERIMFYADAVMFANGDEEGSWSIDDAWPKELVSTLAHEFVHMIAFYQKTLMLLPDDSDNIDTWLNEMLAESTEDLVATKIGHTGPRGVEHTDGSAGKAGNEEGRYGLFNVHNTLSLTSWNATLADYSKVNAFGAYLLRNYGGAQIFHDIMHNKYTDEKAVVNAVNKAIGVSDKTFNDLQREWGIAVMLSDNESLASDVPTYNTGDFTNSVYNGVTYELGSVNFFNYIPTPRINTSVSSVETQGNYYYKVGDNLTGTVNINLTLDSSTEATLIVK